MTKLKQTKPIDLHHLELEVIDCSENEITLDCTYFVSEKEFVKIVGMNYIKKRKGDIIYIDANSSKIT